MALTRIALAILLCIALSGAAPAQGMAAGLAAAQQKITAKEWVAALDLLLGLQAKTATDPEQEQLAGMLMEVGGGLGAASAFADAVRAHAAALAMQKRLHGDHDHPNVAMSSTRLAASYRQIGKPGMALPHDQAALAMRQRLHGGRDHTDVALSLNNLGVCLANLGNPELALPQFEAALAMRQRLHPDGDHPDVAVSLNNVARCRFSLGQSAQALPQFEKALAMHGRIHGDHDDPDVAMCLCNLAACFRSLSQADKALPLYEAALAMRRRLHPAGAHPGVATSLNDLAVCLGALGRSDQALSLFEATLELRQRLYRGDHPAVAEAFGNTATCLDSLGLSHAALPMHEAGLAMGRRLHGERDHGSVAMSLGNLAICLDYLGMPADALPHYQDSLAMYRRLHGDDDHPDVAGSLKSVARCNARLGHTEGALSQFQTALAMRQRLYGDRDHWDVAWSLSDTAECLLQLGQADRALESCELACAMIERLRQRSETSVELRQSLFDKLKRTNAFERLQTLTHAVNPGEALRAAERSRARELLDVLDQQRADPLDEALRRARQRRDVTAAARMQSLRSDLDRATFDGDRLLRQLTTLDDSKIAEAEREPRRKELIEQSDRVAERRRQLLDERARLVADALPVGRVRTAAEIQAALQDGELLLEFTISKAASFLYVVARAGMVQALPLPTAAGTVERALPLLLRRTSHEQLDDRRGRDPDAGGAPAADASDPRELFASLIPKDLWPRLQSARRVFVAAHRSLHRLPFELLITDIKDGKPVYWLDSGPAIAYVQSGSALCWQRQRVEDAGDTATSIDMFTVGDPRQVHAEPEVPEQGALVLAVDEGSEGARLGLQPQDVLVAYDGTPLTDDTTLHDLSMQTEAAIEGGKRSKAPIPIEIWRRGTTQKLEASQGQLGIRVGKGKARQAYEASLGGDAELERIKRRGDLDRLGHLPPLRGARQEATEITAQFAAMGRKAECRLGKDATEPAVFDLAAKAKYLHFACHGIAEEYAGQSLSMLVLSQPQHVLPEDDGLLKLDDLLHRWRGRLASCRLVVLSACRTNVGPLYRDEAPQALPLGFLFAGASAVVSSLWAVDDDSTRELMTDFYSHLLAGEPDRLKAFTAAKKALRAQTKYAEPFHWAPFLYLGSPE